MQRLCSLNAIRTFVFINMITSIAMAIPSEISFSTLSTEISGNPSLEFPSSQKRDSNQYIVSIKSPTISEYFRIKTEVTAKKEDYSNYSIQDSLGNTHFLNSDFDKNETSGLLAVELTKGIYGLSLSQISQIGDSPFRSNQTEFSSYILLNQGLSQIGFSLSNGKTSQPQNYYTELSSGILTPRPSKISSNSIGVYLDQTISELWKTNIRIETSTKTDRPRSLGLVNRHALALSSRDFANVELAYYAESTNENLRDERGYFTLNSAETSYSRYLTYDLSLDVAYGLIVEKEDNPQNQKIGQFASDVLSVGIAYQGKTWRGEFNTQKLNSNIAFNYINYGGNISWTF